MPLHLLLRDRRSCFRKRAPKTGAGAAAYPESVTRLIDELAKLPGIGRQRPRMVLAFCYIPGGPEE